MASFAILDSPGIALTKQECIENESEVEEKSALDNTLSVTFHDLSELTNDEPRVAPG